MLLLWTASGVWCSSVKPALSDNLEKVHMYALQIMLWKLLQESNFLLCHVHCLLPHHLYWYLRTI